MTHPRHPEELLASGLAVIDFAFCHAASGMSVLYSGGHDSGCAAHVASQHPKFDGVVHRINTGIGAKAASEYARDTASHFGWRLVEWRSDSTYEMFVRKKGFPGPGSHRWVYIRLKERCVRDIIRGRGRQVLLTGCRSQESTRRMGYVEPVKHGEDGTRKGRKVTVCLNRVWCSPCHDWTVEEQTAYMDWFDIPRNPVKIALGMSGECFCGAFASPGEIDRIRTHAPDVAEEIDRLAVIARECDKHDQWGTRPPSDPKGLIAVSSGKLCSGCEYKARSSGVIFVKGLR